MTKSVSKSKGKKKDPEKAKSLVNDEVKVKKSPSIKSKKSASPVIVDVEPQENDSPEEIPPVIEKLPRPYSPIYESLLNQVPAECVTVPLIMECILEQVTFKSNNLRYPLLWGARARTAIFNFVLKYCLRLSRMWIKTKICQMKRQAMTTTQRLNKVVGILGNSLRNTESRTGEPLCLNQDFLQCLKQAVRQTIPLALSTRFHFT
jgi:hypothetical protein